MTYLVFTQLIQLIDEPNRSGCLQVYEDNKEKFEFAKGSQTKHQNWQGGYIQHLEEIMNIGLQMYGTFYDLRLIPFSISDIMLVMFLHDLEKPWKYSPDPEDAKFVKSFPNVKAFIEFQMNKYNISLTPEQYNGLKYIHGEGDDYDPKVRIQLPLAAFVHCCDTMSARIWFDYPKQTKTGW
jgi:hypothetical protein